MSENNKFLADMTKAPGTTAVHDIPDPKFPKLSDEDWDFINSYKKQAILRTVGGYVGLGGFCGWGMRGMKKSLPISISFGLFMGIFGATIGIVSNLPEISRDGVINLPPNSPLKMVLYQLAQRNNPLLSPQQIFSICYHKQADSGKKLPSLPLN